MTLYGKPGDKIFLQSPLVCKSDVLLHQGKCEKIFPLICTHTQITAHSPLVSPPRGYTVCSVGLIGYAS